MSRDEPRVAIVGGGIAGLTAALCFAARGWRSRVFEAAPIMEALGAGLQLSPNALRVLRDLGLMPELSRRGVSADSVTLRDMHTGRRLARVPVRGSDGTPYLSIHRADLQAVLLTAAEASERIDLQLGHRLTGIEERDAGLRLAFDTPFGVERVEAPLAIGADGVRSRLAAAANLSPAGFSGRIAWRAMSQTGAAAQAQGIEAWLSAGSHAVTYPVSGGQRTNLVVIRKAVSADDPGAQPSLAPPRLRADSRIGRMIAEAASWAPWPLLEAPADRPYRLFGNKVLLIGDAAHAMSPFAAQGAALAIEDAAVMAHRLTTMPSPEEAFQTYEAERRSRIDAVRRRVAFHRFVYHLPFPLTLGRDAALRLRSEAALSRDLAWLYDWTPPAL